jgi:hypothetical protein
MYCGVFPGKGEVHSSRRNFEIVRRREFRECGLNRSQETIAGKPAPIEVKLKGTNTRGEIDHSFEPFFFEPRLECMHPESLLQIEEIRTELDQEVPIA